MKKAFAAQPKSSCGQHNNEPDDQATTDAEKYIKSVVHAMVAKMQPEGEKTEPSKPKVTLRSILKQAKNLQPLQCPTMYVSLFSSERREMQEEKVQQLGTKWDPGGQQEVENSNIFNKTQQPCTSI